MGILTEKTLLQDIKVSNTNTMNDVNSLVDQVGEVQVNPTQYSLLDRLKTISLSGNASKFTSIMSTVIRPNDTDPYLANDIINVATNSTTLPYFDFTGHEGEYFDCKFTTLYNTNAGLIPIVLRTYDIDTLTGQNLGDNQPYDPSLSEILAHSLTIGSISSANKQQISVGTYCDQFTQRPFIIPASGKVYYALVTLGAFTMSANETISFQLLGTFITPL